MIGLLVAWTFASAPPFVDDANFPKASQERALVATLRLVNKQGGTATAVRIGTMGGRVFYLTACHTIPENSNEVDLEAYTVQSWPKPSVVLESCQVVERWKNVDLAIIRAFEPDATGFAQVSPKDKSPTGADVPLLIVGCSKGAEPTFLIDTGNRRRVMKPMLSPAWSWQTTKPPVEGRSGGPVFSVNGYLVGICNGVGGDVMTGDGGKRGYYLHDEEIREKLKDVYGRLLDEPKKP